MNRIKIYHIMARDVNQQKIFSSDDYERFLNILARYCRKNNCKIYSYCLMDNHIHLLLKEGLEPIATTMKEIGKIFSMDYTEVSQTVKRFEQKCKKDKKN